MNRRQRGPRTEPHGTGTDAPISERPSLELHIDELILHGFPAGDLRRIGAAVEQELARLLAGPGGLQPGLKSREMTRADGGAFEVTANSGPETIGAQVAQMVYGQITQVP